MPAYQTKASQLEVVAPDSPHMFGMSPGQALLCFSGVAFVLRVLFLGRKSFWTDESVSYFLATANPGTYWKAIWDHELNMFPYYQFLRLWAHVGHSEATLRLFSVIFGVLTIPIFYLLAKKLFSSRVALIASALLVLNAGHVAYSQEARGYTMALFLSVAGSLFLLRALGIGESVGEESSAWNWVAYAVLSSLAVYTHFFVLLVVVAQFVSLLALGGKRIPWMNAIGSGVVITLSLLPLFWFVLRRQTDQLDWVPALSFTTVSKAFVLIAGNAIALIFYAALWIVAARRWRREHSGSDDRWRYAFLFAWLLLPILITMACSLHRSVFFARFLIVCMPAAVILAAAGIDLLASKNRILALSLLLLASLGGVAYTYTRPPQEDWRSATAYVLKNATCTDAVYLLPEYGHFSFDYYRRSYSRSECGNGTPRTLSLTDPAPVSTNNVWIVLLGPEKLPAKLASDLERLRETKMGYRFELVSERRFKLVRVLQYSRSKK